MGEDNLIQGVFQANNSEQKTENQSPLKEQANQGKNDPANLLFENRVEREWLETKEAAHFLSITPNALRIMVHRDQVRVFKFGRRLRFRLADLRALFERKGA